MIDDMLQKNPNAQFVWSGKVAIDAVEKFGLLKESAAAKAGFSPFVQCDVCSTHQTHWILGMRVTGMAALSDNGLFVRCLPRSQWPASDMTIFVQASLAAFGLHSMDEPGCPDSSPPHQEGILDYLAAHPDSEYTVADDRKAQLALVDLAMGFPPVSSDRRSAPAHRVCYCLGYEHPTHWIVAVQYSGMQDLMNGGHVLKFLPRVSWSQDRLKGEIARLLDLMGESVKPVSVPG